MSWKTNEMSTHYKKLC